MLALCSLPRTNPDQRYRYVRRNGPYTLVMSATGINKLPYGNLPCLILAWVSTEAVRTGSREIVLREIALRLHAGARRLQQQRWKAHPAPQSMKRLFGCTVSMTYEDKHGDQFVSSLIAERGVAGEAALGEKRLNDNH